MSSFDDPSAQTTLIHWRDAPEVAVAPCLVVLYGGELGRRLELRSDDIAIGRAPECELVVGDADISREHCRVLARDGRHFVRDLASTNGTWLDDRRLESGRDTLLESGARLRIGGLVLKYLGGRDVESLYHEEIHRLTISDGLTGLYNRRFFEEFLEREVTRWRRHRRPVSLVIFDVDYLKDVNDTHGHPAGDDALRELARTVRHTVRAEACLARLSGDEFAVVLPETSRECARVFCERLRGTVDAATLRVGDTELSGLTISAGIAEICEELAEPAALIEAADRNLYRAKQAGRNQVVG